MGFTLANMRDRWAFVCGGSDDTEVLRTVERFSFETSKWEELPGMHVARKHPSSTCLGNSLYVVSGSGYSHSNLNSIDRYVNGVGWTLISINDGNTVPRLSPIISVLNNQTLVVLGGFASRPLPGHIITVDCGPNVTLSTKTVVNTNG